MEGQIKKDIKNYWEDKLPQTWYSKKTPNSKEWFAELESERYAKHFPYLCNDAEFDKHPNKKVLEIGVGVGSDLVQFAKSKSIVSGIDLTENAIKTTKLNFDLRGLRYESLQSADAEALPFDDNTFDIVYSFGVLHHTDNTQKAIDEVYRVLKPGGKAIIMLYANGISHYLKRVLYYGIIRGEFFKMSMQEINNKNNEIHGGTPMTRIYSRKTVTPLFSKFKVDSIVKRGGYFFVKLHIGAWASNFAKKMNLERWIGSNWMIKAYK